MSTVTARDGQRWRKLRVLQMRREGRSVRQIADALGVSVRTVRYDLAEARDQHKVMVQRSQSR